MTQCNVVPIFALRFDQEHVAWILVWADIDDASRKLDEAFVNWMVRNSRLAPCVVYSTITEPFPNLIVTLLGVILTDWRNAVYMTSPVQ